MKVIKELSEMRLDKPACVTIGKFDGIHRGHQELIRLVTEYARVQKEQGRDVKTVMVAINIPGTKLLLKKERRKILEKLGIDVLCECAFNRELMTMEAPLFIKSFLVGQLKAEHIVIGPDFRFGFERRGDGELLETMGEECGFTSKIAPYVMDHGVKVSSSLIREELAKGDMERVKELMGFPFPVSGEIVHGRQIGRSMGIPTTNLIPSKSKLLPPKGVYATVSGIEDKIYYGMTNIGTKPTVDGSFVGVETYLYGCNEDLYGKKQQVGLMHFMRPEIKFDSLDELKAQIEKDRTNVRKYFGI